MRFTTRSNVRERITRIQSNLNAFPQQIADITQEVVDKAEPDVLQLLTFTPPTPRYPYGKFPWQTEKQRRAYFATNGFGNGIPYRRKGNANKGWRLFGVARPNGATVIVQNEWDKYKYVGGTFMSDSPQQRFHDATGWTKVKTLRADVYRILIDTYRDVIRDKATQLIFD